MRESFVVHTEFLDKIPDAEKGTWLMYIYNYGANETEPELSNWLEEALWSKIKQRMDKDRESWEETKKARSEAGKMGAEKRWNKNPSSMAKDSKVIENDSDAKLDIANMAVSVSVSDTVSVYDSGSVSVETPHCTTSLSKDIKNTTLLYGFTLTPGQTKSFLEKTESFNGDLPCLANFIIKRTMEKYENKPRDEMIRLYINALSKYPEEFIDDFYAVNRTEQKKKNKESKRLIYFNPPSTKCSCGHEMLERSDTDESTGIDYTAYKCPECNTMLTCENGKWTYSQGAPDFSMVAV